MNIKHVIILLVALFKEILRVMMPVDRYRHEYIYFMWALILPDVFAGHDLTKIYLSFS